MENNVIWTGQNYQIVFQISNTFFLFILQSLDELNFGSGISLTKFDDVLCNDIQNGIFMKYDNYLGPVHDDVY